MMTPICESVVSDTSNDLRFHSYLEDLRTIASRLDSIPDDDKRKMKKAPMFLAFRYGMATPELLPAEQVPIGDWAGRDFVGNVFVAPKDDILLKSTCASSGARYQITHIYHRNVPRDGFSISGDIRAA